MPAGYGNDNDYDGNSHDENDDSTDFRTRNFTFSKRGPRAEGWGKQRPYKKLFLKATRY